MEKSQEDNFWVIKAGKETVGMVLIYVDDFLFLGSHKVVQGAVEAVSQTWTCSKPMFASETEAITFCGLTSESTRNLKVLCCHNKPTNRSFGREGRAGVDWSSFMVEYKMPSGDHAVHVMSKHAVRENNF